MDTVTAAVRYARATQTSTLARLHTLLRYPTVSADPRCARDMTACAAWLARTLSRIGLANVEVHRGQVAPVVTAAWRGRPGRPTVLVTATTTFSRWNR